MAMTLHRQCHKTLNTQEMLQYQLQKRQSLHNDAIDSSFALINHEISSILNQKSSKSTQNDVSEALWRVHRNHAVRDVH